MITIKEAKNKAKAEMPELEIISCIDIGNRYAFSFGVDKDNIPPGTPIVCIDKEKGEISFLTIPPIRNIELLEKGKEIDLTTIK